MEKWKGKVDWSMTRRYFIAESSGIELYHEVSGTACVSWEGSGEFRDWQEITADAQETVDNSAQKHTPSILKGSMARDWTAVTVSYWASPIYSVIMED